MHHKPEPTHTLTHLEREIIMKLSELLFQNTSIKNQLNKVEVEIVAKLAELQAAVDKLTENLADITLTDEQTQSVLDVQTAVDALDKIVPDPTPVEPIEAS
jgi:flagellar motor switch protein FliM